MSRGSSEARKRISRGIQRRGPNRAESLDGVVGVPGPADVFEHLDRCSNLLTAKELGALLAVSPKTIYGYVARNLIPHYRIAASVRFRARDIAEWLRSHAA
jgi:excisionase family DNA binding protein